MTLAPILISFSRRLVSDHRSAAWHGPGGGYITGVNLSWRVGVDEISLYFNPEGGDGRGNLRYSKSASVTYGVADARCP
jgi:hypothetical protein